MSYFYSFQSWLYHTSIYQNLLRELPAPLNNIYFDSILCICLALYLIYRLVETVHIIRYRMKIRKKQESERKRRLEKTRNFTRGSERWTRRRNGSGDSSTLWSPCLLEE